MHLGWSLPSVEKWVTWLQITSKKHVTSMGWHLSLWSRHVILVSGNLVLTAVNWCKNGCAISGSRLPHKLEGVRFDTGYHVVWMGGRTVTWLPKLFGWIDKQIFLAIELRACMEVCYYFVMVQFYPWYKWYFPCSTQSYPQKLGIKLNLSMSLLTVCNVLKCLFLKIKDVKKMVQKYGFAVVSGCSLLHHSSDKTQPCLY